MSDQIVSWIRTVVPAGIAAAATLLAKRTGVVLDADTSQQLTLGVTGLIFALYYPAVRWAEARWPVAGWLLGVAKAPTYEGTGVVLRSRRAVGPALAPVKGQVWTRDEIIGAIELADGDLSRLGGILDSMQDD